MSVTTRKQIRVIDELAPAACERADEKGPYKGQGLFFALPHTAELSVATLSLPRVLGGLSGDGNLSFRSVRWRLSPSMTLLGSPIPSGVLHTLTPTNQL